MRSSLDRLTELENQEVWKDNRDPEKEEDFFDCPIHMDIWTVTAVLFHVVCSQ